MTSRPKYSNYIAALQSATATFDKVQKGIGSTFSNMPKFQQKLSTNRVTISAQMKKRTHIFSSNPVTNPYSSPIGLRQIANVKCCTNKSKVKLHKTLFFLIFVCK